MEKIIVAFENEDACRKAAEIIQAGGAASCVTLRRCADVKHMVHKLRASIVVCGYRLADGPCEDLFRELPPTCSMLMVANRAQLDMVDEGIFKLPVPVSKSGLCACVEMLLQANRQKGKYLRPRRSDEERAVVEKAKKRLMERSGMTEEAAHRYLQKQSMDSGARLPQTAQAVLDGRV